MLLFISLQFQIIIYLQKVSGAQYLGLDLVEFYMMEDAKATNQTVGGGGLGRGSTWISGLDETTKEFIIEQVKRTKNMHVFELSHRMSNVLTSSLFMI